MSYGRYGGGGGGYGQSNPYAGQSGGGYGGNQGGYGQGAYGNTGGNGGYSAYSSNNAGRYGDDGGAYGQSNVDMPNAGNYGGAQSNTYNRPAAGGLPSGPGGNRPQQRPPVNNYNNENAYGGNNGNGYEANDGGYEMDQRNDVPPPSQAPIGQNRPTGGSVLEQCTAIDETITELESRLQSVKQLQSRILSDRANISELDNASTDIMAGYRNLANRMKKIKSNPDSGAPRNAPQVGRIDRRLKQSMNDYQRLESEFRSQMREQQARQYRIVNPNATETEVREAVEDPNTDIFQQALLNSNRRGQAQSTLNAVRARHEAIQNIERTMIELAELFQDLDTMVVQQEEQIRDIEEKGIEVQENIVEGNKELDTGISSARAARKKKWICLFIAIFVIIAIAIAVTVYFLINKKSDPAAPAPAVATVTAAPPAKAVSPARVMMAIKG